MKLSSPTQAFVTAALTLCLAACATAPAAPPAPPTPPRALAPAWLAPLPPSAPPGALSSAPPGAEGLGWWRRFNDPLLLPLIESAQQASTTLASAAARVERARAARSAAGSALAPRVDGVAAATQRRITPGVPAIASLSLGAQAAWEIDLFGAAAAGRDAAQARFEGSQAALQDARTAVSAEVASSYTSLRACEGQLIQAQADAASRAETARLTELSARAGFTAPADAALVRASAAQARSQALSQRAACDAQFKSLVELTDIPEAELRVALAPGHARVPTAPALAVVVVPAQWLSQRPDIADAARQVAAAASDRAQAQARERPQVSLTGSIAGASVRTAGETATGATWSLGPLTVTFPLFDGGARAAATASAQATYDEAVATYRAQVRRAVREVEGSLVSLQATAEREADARVAAQDFEASLRATAARQKGGLASLFDLEAARRNALQAQSALIDLQRDRTAAWIGLFRALGGGWQADIPTT